MVKGVAKKENDSFSLTAGWTGWIKSQVDKGEYRNKSDVVEKALKEFKQKVDPNTPLSKFTS